MTKLRQGHPSLFAPQIQRQLTPPIRTPISKTFPMSGSREIGLGRFQREDDNGLASARKRANATGKVRASQRKAQPNGADPGYPGKWVCARCPVR